MPGHGHGCAATRPRHRITGSAVVWAVSRFDEGHQMNIKKFHRLWREEGLQVRAHHPHKRAGTSSVPAVDADAPKVVWAKDFQCDSTVEGRVVKNASMIDARTRESLSSDQ